MYKVSLRWHESGSQAQRRERTYDWTSRNGSSEAILADVITKNESSPENVNQEYKRSVARETDQDMSNV